MNDEHVPDGTDNHVISVDSLLTEVDRDRDDPSINVDLIKMCDLAQSIWRIHRRARNKRVDETVILACETAVERLSEIGVKLDDMLSHPYDDSLQVKVIEKSGDTNLMIVECLSPAVYINGKLCRLAEVMIGSNAQPVISNRA